MSYFAGGGWRNTTSPLAQATTTTNNVSASRQGSVDESIAGALGERKPLLRSQTDTIAHTLIRKSSQSSLASNANVDPAAGRRYTFRGIARALPYFLRSTPATTTVSVAPQEAERNVVSVSPPQSVIDIQARIPVKQSSLGQDVPTAVESGTDEVDSEAGREQTESVESGEQRGRCVSFDE